MSQIINKKIISLCGKNNQEAQRTVYNAFAPTMLGVCLRYLKEKQIAEDVMQDAFIVVFTKIKQFSGKGSFEGWVRRIMVNSALVYLRKNKQYDCCFDDIGETSIEFETEKIPDVDYKNSESVIKTADFSQAEMMEAVWKLPKGFREVFNLYAVEGYKHKEIAEILDISIGTSKSQLMRARKKIQEILYREAIKKHKEKRKQIF